MFQPSPCKDFPRALPPHEKARRKRIPVRREALARVRLHHIVAGRRNELIAIRIRTRHAHPFRLPPHEIAARHHATAPRLLVHALLHEIRHQLLRVLELPLVRLHLHAPMRPRRDHLFERRMRELRQQHMPMRTPAAPDALEDRHVLHRHALPLVDAPHPPFPPLEIRPHLRRLRHIAAALCFAPVRQRQVVVPEHEIIQAQEHEPLLPQPRIHLLLRQARLRLLARPPLLVLRQESHRPGRMIPPLHRHAPIPGHPTHPHIAHRPALPISLKNLSDCRKNNSFIKAIRGLAPSFKKSLVKCSVTIPTI